MQISKFVKNLFHCYTFAWRLKAGKITFPRLYAFISVLSYMAFKSLESKNLLNPCLLYTSNQMSHSLLCTQSRHCLYLLPHISQPNHLFQLPVYCCRSDCNFTVFEVFSDFLYSCLLYTARCV